MATVFLARDLLHQRLVALKVVHPEIAASLGPERFQREIRLAAVLQHPHILPLHDSGESDGRLWFTMPYVEGESLRERLNREPQLPLDVALRIVIQVADALGYAHEQGVVHRDIKPENILMAGGHAVIADFGIARALEAAGGEKLTATGLALGTPAYMSPEQATCDPHLDGRSDTYSLGCVLFEMLAGEPPFTGRTPQAIVARRMSEPVPKLRVLREVPEGIEQAVTRALARSPADRFPTAAGFAHALETAGRQPVGRQQRRIGRLLYPLGALLAAAVAFGLYQSFSSPPASKPDPDLLVVAPFDVHEPDLQLWREGLVDILSRDLDGAGRLRTVPQTVALRRWAGRADRPSAALLAEKTGAGVVVFGNVLRKGADSVSLRAAVLDRASSDTQHELEVVGEERRLGELADSLGVRILRSLGRERPIGAVRHVTIGSRSLPSLKQFLRGEQFYRRGLWDSAMAHYDRAIAEDSSFALALSRMERVLSWHPPTSASYLTGREYGTRAFRHNRGLAARDSLLLAAIELDYVLDDNTDLAGFLENRYRAESLLKGAVRRYPQDPEIWYTLGEFRNHNPAPFGGLPSETLAAFERAIALDPGFAPAYDHTVQLAITLGRPDLARRYARAYAALDPTDVNAPSLRLAALVLDSGIAAPAVRRTVRTAPANVLFRVGIEHLQSWPDSAESATALLRELKTGHHAQAGAPPFVTDSVMQARYLALALSFRGHLRAALEAFQPTTFAGDTADPYRGFADPFLDLALLGTVADSIAAKTFARALVPDASWWGGFTPRYLRGLPWWFSRRDTASLRRFAHHAAAVVPKAEYPIIALRGRYLGAAASAYLSLAREDSAEAVRRFQAIPDSLCMGNDCFYEKLTLARLLSARGEDRRAGELLDRWVWSEVGFPSFVLATLERARIAERLGEAGKAMEHYRFVVDAWRNADPQLQQYVEEAAAGVKRLGGVSSDFEQ
jgi:serine/threonine-protein kinase